MALRTHITPCAWGPAHHTPQLHWPCAPQSPTTNILRAGPVSPYTPQHKAGTPSRCAEYPRDEQRPPIPSDPLRERQAQGTSSRPPRVRTWCPELLKHLEMILAGESYSQQDNQMLSSAQSADAECPWNAPSSHRPGTCAKRSCQEAVSGWDQPSASWEPHRSRGEHTLLGHEAPHLQAPICQRPWRAHRGPGPGWTVTRPRRGEQAQQGIIVINRPDPRWAPQRGPLPSPPPTPQALTFLMPPCQTRGTTL